MLVDDDPRFDQTPRFQRADVHRKFLASMSTSIGALAVLLLTGVALLTKRPVLPLWRQVLLISAASLCTLLIGLRSAGLVSSARLRSLHAAPPPRFRTPKGAESERPSGNVGSFAP